VGETRVDLLHLLEDLRDAYPGGTEEAILTEIVANSLDSGAATIAVSIDPAAATITIVDDGAGMKRRELARYHDIASSTKRRGEGIGFAGVGIKIGLLASTEVLTETRRGAVHVATTWHLASRNRAPWRWIPPPGLVPARGTAVRLRLDNPMSPLVDPGFVETVMRCHFEPLLGTGFDEILAPRYPHGVKFMLNGESLRPAAWRGPETAPLAIRLARRRKPSAIGYLTRDRAPLPEQRRGVAISTFGKVIRRGWDWLGITPASPDHVGGLIEAPALSECLTLNKADFIRAGVRGAIYLSYRKAVQEAVVQQLQLWGDIRDEADRARRRAARPLERDLETVLMDLADEFPLLASVVAQRKGGQRQLALQRGGHGGTAPVGSALEVVSSKSPIESEPETSSEREARPGPEQAAPPDPTASAAARPPEFPGSTGARQGRAERRPGRYGLSVQFESRPGDPELGRLVESTVWVNEAHPAYRRAAASRSEGYHVALAAALALAALAVEPAKEHAFVTAFLASWGDALDRRRQARRRSAHKGGTS
jgi:Histidine kinase-, DNA gyrase B-, and HSP90-like ATPase